MTIGNYDGASFTADYLNAFLAGLDPIERQLNKATTELAEAGASEDLQHEYKLVIAALEDFTEALEIEANAREAQKRAQLQETAETWFEDRART